MCRSAVHNNIIYLPFVFSLLWFFRYWLPNHYLCNISLELSLLVVILTVLCVPALNHMHKRRVKLLFSLNISLSRQRKLWKIMVPICRPEVHQLFRAIFLLRYWSICMKTILLTTLCYSTLRKCVEIPRVCSLVQSIRLVTESNAFQKSTK